MNNAPNSQVAETIIKARSAMPLKMLGLIQPRAYPPYSSMIDDFKARHAPIHEFLFSGARIGLQNADSGIMEKIMLQVYEEEMGYVPVLKAS